jgi:hypothetical protein
MSRREPADASADDCDPFHVQSHSEFFFLKRKRLIGRKWCFPR